MYSIKRDLSLLKFANYHTLFNLILKPPRLISILFLPTVSLQKWTLRSGELRKWSKTQEALIVGQISSCEDHSKCIEKNNENLHFDVQV